MRILLVNYRYYLSGGPERYMFNIKEMLEKNGHEVIPFSIRSKKNVRTPYEKNFVNPIGGQDAAYYDEVKKTPKAIFQLLTRSCYSFEVKRAVQRIIKDKRPDIVYIIHFVNKLSPSVITGAKQMGVPVVLRLSDYFMLCPRFDFLSEKEICEDCLTRGYRCCIRKRCVKGSITASLVRVFSMKVHEILHVYDKVDAFVTPSMFLKDKLVDAGYNREKIHLIPTFTSNNSEDKKFIVGDYGLYFGRIEVEKGVETAILAYEKMPERKLVIMGNDETREARRLKEYTIEHDIRNISFIGHKSGEELENVIKGSRFTVIPSIWYDNLPNTALESFRYSKPVIASNIGSLPELVLDGFNGMLFRPGDADDLADKIEKLDSNGNLIEEMGNNSRHLLQERFSAEAHYKLLMSLFQSCIVSGRI